MLTPSRSTKLTLTWLPLDELDRRAAADAHVADHQVAGSATIQAAPSGQVACGRPPAGMLTEVNHPEGASPGQSWPGDPAAPIKQAGRASAKASQLNRAGGGRHCGRAFWRGPPVRDVRHDRHRHHDQDRDRRKPTWPPAGLAVSAPAQDVIHHPHRLAALRYLPTTIRQLGRHRTGHRDSANAASPERLGAGLRAARGYAYCRSRKCRRIQPMAAASAPRPVMTAALDQSGLAAGAGIMWKKMDVSSSQWLVCRTPPANSTRKDQARYP